jgi:multidrug resistance efflux pump
MDLTSINDVGGRQRSLTSLGSRPTAAQSEPDLSFRTASSPIPTSASATLAGRLAYAEERIERAEKDNAIAQTELTMLREATRQQLNTLRSERNELKQRLNSIVNNLDQVCPDIFMHLYLDNIIFTDWSFK